VKRSEHGAFVRWEAGTGWDEIWPIFGPAHAKLEQRKMVLGSNGNRKLA